ncbi:MAG: hypothetical protein ACW98W_20315 [Candidatus Hodarchaeales archaeon]|jgi:hypothetical protein
MVVDKSGKSMYLWPLITSIIGILLLLTDEFGAWQDRNPFFGVTEGFVWIGSTKAAPWAQIGILILVAGLGYCAYVAWNGYQDPSNVTGKMIQNAFRAALGVAGLSVLFGLGFMALVFNSDWWWFGGGFYGALGSGALTTYLFRRVARTTRSPILSG